MLSEQIKTIIEKHQLWLNGKGCKANLSGADLYKADLSWANLSEANLSLANLSWANLSEANLSEAKYSIVTIMKCNWGHVSNDLTLELIRHDAQVCGIEAMNEWAKGGECPFRSMRRKYHFQENRKLWKPGEPTMKIKELFQALVKEKNIKI